jgi:predicted transcriptional regulator
MKKNNSVFSWAQSDNARLRAPDEQLQVKGFTKGERPLASNINWIFKSIGENLRQIQKQQVESDAKNQALYAQLLEKIDVVTKTAEEIKVSHNKFKEKATHQMHHNRGDSRFNLGIIRQLLNTLKNLESYLKHYHPSLPALNWPLHKDSNSE